MDDWDKHLLQVMGAYNSTEHSTTGKKQHMMLTCNEKALPLTFFYPEYDGKRTASQMYVRDVIRRQQDLNDLCMRNTLQAQIEQKRIFDSKNCRCKSLLSWWLRLGVPGRSSTKKNSKIIKKRARLISDNRSAPRRLFLSIEHRKSSSLRKHKTAQCLIRGLVYLSGHAGGRLFDSGSCLWSEWKGYARQKRR